MKKNNGFTLLELIIVVALVLVILSIVLSLFINITKTNSEVKVRAMLETETQDISEKISNTGMEALGIGNVTLENGTVIKIGDADEQEYSAMDLVNSVNEKDSNLENNQWISVKKIEIKNKYEKINDEGSSEIVNTPIPLTISYENSKLSIIKEKFDDRNAPIGTTISYHSEHVESMLIKPSNLESNSYLGKIIMNGSNKISDANSIEVKINLVKRVGESDIRYSVPITVTFRNKGM